MNVHLYPNIGGLEVNGNMYNINTPAIFDYFLKTCFFGYRHMHQKAELYGRKECAVKKRHMAASGNQHYESNSVMSINERSDCL